MERRNFIKLSGLTTFGLVAGSNLFAFGLEIKNHQLIEINRPNIHVRHGFFNLQTPNQNKLYVQRDLFNKSGLEAISEDRMASIKIVRDNDETFGIMDHKGFKSTSKKLSAIKLKANKITFVNVDTQSLIFAEYDALRINGTIVKNDHAFCQTSKGEIGILSKINQSVFIYKDAL